MNHHALFIKLMTRIIQLTVLTILENLFLCCMSCVKWDFTWSATFQINFEVRQGSVKFTLFIMFYCFVLYIVLYCYDTNVRGEMKDYHNDVCGPRP